MRRLALPAIASLIVALGITTPMLMSNPAAALPQQHPTCHPWGHCRTSGTPTPTPTTPTPSPTNTTPTGTPTPTPTTTSPSPSTTPTPTGTACVIHLGGSCGAYSWNIMDNGFNSYVADQGVGPQSGTQETITANSATSWADLANDVPYGYTGVQTAPQTNQLMNDYCPANHDWADPVCASNQTETDTPFSALSSLRISYAESSPPDGVAQGQGIYEYGIDTWPDNYSNDIMTWTDTSFTRCTQNGMSASNILGQMPLGGQNFTLYHFGTELIFILDGTSSTDPVTTGTCARQTSGTIDVLGEFQWLAANKFIPGLGPMGLIVPALWEVTSANNAKFTVSSLSLTITAAL